MFMGNISGKRDLLCRVKTMKIPSELLKELLRQSLEHAQKIHDEIVKAQKIDREILHRPMDI